MINNDQSDVSGYAIQAQSRAGAVYADNVYRDGTGGRSINGEDNPDIVLGGEYIQPGGTTGVDYDNGPGVIASDPNINLSDMYLRSNDELYLYKAYYAGSSSEFRIYDGPSDPANIQARLDTSEN